MECGHEAHEHDHGECGHGGSSLDGPDRGSAFSLYRHVDLDRAWCLNESAEGSVKRVLKPWDDRLDISLMMESDADEQLLVYIPFTGSVKLKAIGVLGGPEPDESPSEMRCWINRDDIDFDVAESMEPLQKWDLIRDPPNGDVLEYQTRISKFNNVRSLTLFFPSNFGGGDETRIRYLGFKGEFEQLRLDPVVTVFELNANPADHPKTEAESWVGRSIQ